MLAWWILVFAVSLALTLYASRRAVGAATELSTWLPVPPFFVGLTLVALGTDLPEIANSIVACAMGHGDLNVGDSVGSAVTQATLILGALPFLAGAFTVGRSQVVLTGLLTAGALALGVILVADGRLSRIDGALLVTGWLVASVLIWRHDRPERELPLEASRRTIVHDAGAALFYLALVGLGATGIVIAFIRFSELLGVPEYLISFFAASLGTSLPELFVDLSAIRRGATAIGVGGIFGASMIDSTLSIGIGPLIAPASVSAELAVRGGLAAVGVLLVVTLLFSRIRQHDWRSGMILILLYLAFYPILLAG